MMFSTPPCTESHGILGQGPVIIAPSQSLVESTPPVLSPLTKSTSSPLHVATTIITNDPNFPGTKNQAGTPNSHSSSELSSSESLSTKSSIDQPISSSQSPDSTPPRKTKSLID